MLPPNELKNKEFTKAVRGYNSEEVDEHINFIIEKYSELYRENDELERRLKLTQAKLDALRRDEESIRTALINAQKAGATIINEANERAEVIMRAAKTNLDRVLAEFRANIRIERDNAVKLREITAKFKRELLTTYSEHIEYIEGINTEVEGLDEINITEDALVRAAMTAIRGDVEQNAERLANEAEAEEAKKKAEAEAKEKAEAEAKLKAEAEAKIKAETEAKIRAEAEAKIKAEIEAKYKAEAEAKIKAETAARLKEETEAREKSEAEARIKAENEALIAAEEETKKKAQTQINVIQPVVKDIVKETDDFIDDEAEVDEEADEERELEDEFVEEELPDVEINGDNEEADDDEADYVEQTEYIDQSGEENEQPTPRRSHTNRNLPPRINPKPGSVKDEIVKLVQQLGAETADENIAEYADDNEMYSYEEEQPVKKADPKSDEDDFGEDEFDGFRPSHEKSNPLGDDEDRFAGYEEIPIAKPTAKTTPAEEDDAEFDSLIKKMEEQTGGKKDKNDRNKGKQKSFRK